MIGYRIWSTDDGVSPEQSEGGRWSSRLFQSSEAAEEAMEDLISAYGTSFWYEIVEEDM